MDYMRNQRPYASASSSAATYDEGLRQYMLGIYNYMTGALALTGFVAFLVANTSLINLFYTVSEGMVKPNLLGYVVMFAPLIMVFYLSARLHHMSVRGAQTAFMAYAGLMGLSLANIFLVYTGESIVSTLLVTAASFAGLSLYGYTTKRDLSGFGSFLIMGVIGILIASIVNMFLHSSALHFAISAIGVLVFAGLTAYDTQSLRRMYYEVGGSGEAAAKVSIMGALKLYLDFINLFIMLLQFLGDRR